MSEAVKIITIDGPAGSGKGTVGQKLALELGWHFLDSGALYRTCALIADRNSLTNAQPKAIVGLLGNINFKSIPRSDGAEADVLLNGENVSSQIRTPAFAQLASELAVNGNIRTALLVLQNSYLSEPGLVADGRDMGSVVYPQADLKVYLDASPITRAQRKYNQLKQQGKCANFDMVHNAIKKRDNLDSTRSQAPLVTPEGAFVIDSSSMSPDEVLKCILDEFNVVLNEEN